MLEDRSRDIESMRKRWNERAKRYDEWYKTFEGAVEQYVDWELLKGYLPQNRDAKILDVAGGVLGGSHSLWQRRDTQSLYAISLPGC